MQKATFEVMGMSCGHCVKAVDQAVASVAGIVEKQVAIGSVAVAFDDAQTDASRIAAAIEDAGYQVRATR